MPFRWEALKSLVDSSGKVAFRSCLDQSMLLQFLSHEESKGATPSVLRSHVMVLRQFGRHLFNLGLVSQDPSRHLPSIRVERHTRVHDFLDVEDLRAIAYGLVDEAARGEVEPLRDLALLLLGSEGGLRPIELRTAWLEEQGRVTWVRSELRKEPVVLTETPLLALAVYLEHPMRSASGVNPLLLEASNECLTTSRLCEIVRSMAWRHGVMKPVTPSWLRRTYATQLWRLGADPELIRQLMRQAQQETGRFYIDKTVPVENTEQSRKHFTLEECIVHAMRGAIARGASH